jgi:NTE family protein
VTRVGLVLGAGGLVGQAYHAGVLAALEHDLGWDPRRADVIVGSSAGALTGAALRMGVPASDLAAWAVSAEPSDEGRAFLTAIGKDPEVPPFELSRLFRGWHLPSPQLLARVTRRPWAIRPLVAALTLVPDGWVDLSELAADAAPLLGDEWPEGLRICAARRRDGARTTFGRAGAPTPPLHEAVLASCAIPGYFRPVVIDGVEYFDGGVHSPTNADVLADEDLDLVIVSSPMSSAHGRSFTLDATPRRSAHLRLEREVRRLRDRGTEVVRFEPSPRLLKAMGLNAMDSARSSAVTLGAFLDAGRHANEQHAAALLSPLCSRRMAAA